MLLLDKNKSEYFTDQLTVSSNLSIILSRLETQETRIENREVSHERTSLSSRLCKLEVVVLRVFTLVINLNE